MNRNVLEDLPVLTGIPKFNFEKLVKRCNALINHYTYEAFSEGENIVYIDVGIGKLIIQIEEKCVKYSFEPSIALDKSVKSALKSDVTDLVKLIDNTLEKRIQDTYKELT